jgi:transcriptional regulator with XRE-family HTH domain
MGTATPSTYGGEQLEDLMVVWNADDRSSETFHGLLLLSRGRTGLTQRQLADRVGVSARSVQDWEAGVSHPGAERLQHLVAALLEAGGLSAGCEAEEARAIWAAAERASPRQRAPFDPVWFARLLGDRAVPVVVSDRPAVWPGAAGGASEHRQDWGEAPDALGFVGRTDERAMLREWILKDRCRLVAVVGMGGVGKTSLAARLAEEIAPTFGRVYWRSLRDAPPVGDWLAGTIGFLSDRALAPPASESERLTVLLGLLRDRPCLLVLDNFEALFEPGRGEGRYRTGQAGYGRLLEVVGDSAHQSCLVLTSREEPTELVVPVGDAVRTLRLGGLTTAEARALLAPKQLAGTDEQWAELIARFGGNGLALKLIGESIHQVFGGEIGELLEQTGVGDVFGGIRRLLAEQVERSSVPEWRVLRALAVEREPVRLTALVAAIGPRVGRGAVVEAVESLHRRSLIERVEAAGGSAFMLQSVVRDYVAERLVEASADEIEHGRLVLPAEQPLAEAPARDGTPHSQERLLGSIVPRRLRVEGEAGSDRQRLPEQTWDHVPQVQGFPASTANRLAGWVELSADSPVAWSAC